MLSAAIVLEVGSLSLTRSLPPRSGKRREDLTDKLIFLSINRFERKKNIGLAVRSFVELQKHVDAATAKRCQLIIAGGYDDRVQENIEHYKELKAIAEEENLSVSDYPDEKGQVRLCRKRCGCGG